ncbi:MAG: SRPBCC family protein [Longimonas sp.]|uniref:SRPBCC family protein n=1 Tax=Longimonas sp. TaxID=2039626 RepID=UPI003345F0E4
MVYVRDQIDIAAPLEDVFAYMDEPAHQADITPSLVESTLIKRLPNGGSHASYVYSFLGVRFKGEVRATTYDPPSHIEFEMEGGLEGQIAWSFKEHNDGTRVVYEAKYDIPVPVLKKAAEAVAKRYNEREVKTLLANLKDHMEAQRVSS